MSSAIAKVFSDRQYTCFECAKLRRCPSPRNGMPADGTTPICFEYKPADPARPQDARELAVRDFRYDELDAVMISVDKWFDEGDPRLKNNPATRAADAREIALRAIEAATVAHDARLLDEAAERGVQKLLKLICEDPIKPWIEGKEELRAAIQEAAHE